MLHSVQLVDASNRLAKTLESSLLLYGTLISHEGNIRQFGIGRRQHLSVERDPESRLLRYIGYLFRSRRFMRDRPKSHSFPAPKRMHPRPFSLASHYGGGLRFV